MSLLNSQFVPCHRMDVSADTPTDGQFGRKEDYTEGEALSAMLRKDNSAEAREAERSSLREQYTIVVHAGVSLKKGDVIRRDSDRATFRVTGNTADGEAPGESTVQIARTTAERWDIP